MRASLSDYLYDVHRLLRNQTRSRGTPPGSALERDLEMSARARCLAAERRVRNGPHGGAYYSGLRPETDLFVYDGPEFLHIEAKDLAGPLARSIPTEFWARALDLHLGRAKDSLREPRRDHYPVLVVSLDATDDLRVACVRWGICLVEPRRIPFPVLASFDYVRNELLRQAGCAAQDLRWVCLSLTDRVPRAEGGVLFPFGPVRSRTTVSALLRLQRIATAEGDRLFAGT
jgi:hypothetical protein